MDSVGNPLFMLGRVVNMVDCFWRTVKTVERGKKEKKAV